MVEHTHSRYILHTYAYIIILVYYTHSQAIWLSRESNLRKGKCHSGYAMDSAGLDGDKNTIRVDCSQPATPHVSSRVCICVHIATQDLL